ncbi:MAG TPA: CU044_2847 family protein [Coleofasciculaceae cyanobacterium]
MPKLQAVQIDEDTIIYVEAEDDVEIPAVAEEPEEQQRGGGKGWDDQGSVAQIARSFEQIQSTIKVYTKYTLNAFKDAALADVQKVTLEFGVNVGGETGVPYVAKGTVGCNVKIVVECAFPQRQVAAAQRQVSAVPGVPRPPGLPANPPANP